MATAHPQRARSTRERTLVVCASIFLVVVLIGTPVLAANGDTVTTPATPASPPAR